MQGVKHMQRWRILAVLTIAAAPFATGAGPADAAQDAKKPNILFIMGDDVGWFNIGAYHQGIMSGKTPNLDKLAAQGMRFTDYYAEASCTAGRSPGRAVGGSQHLGLHEPCREVLVDLYTRMLKENIIFLGTPINDDVANVICGQLLYLEAENPDKEISIYINSPGGDINALLAIYDTMQYVRPSITTLCYGQAASAAAVLLAAGSPGKRLALPNARILIHQPYAQSYGQASDVELAAAEIMRLKTALEDILALHTGQSTERIATDTDRDFVMTAAEAKEYGLIDEVLSNRDFVDNSGPISAVV